MNSISTNAASNIRLQQQQQQQQQQQHQSLSLSLHPANVDSLNHINAVSSSTTPTASVQSQRQAQPGAAALDCPHKSILSCSLGTSQCCACRDTRDHSPFYSRYIDGIGDVHDAPRWWNYCSYCRDGWSRIVRQHNVQTYNSHVPEYPSPTQSTTGSASSNQSSVTADPTATTTAPPSIPTPPNGSTTRRSTMASIDPMDVDSTTLQHNDGLASTYVNFTRAQPMFANIYHPGIVAAIEEWGTLEAQIGDATNPHREEAISRWGNCRLKVKRLLQLNQAFRQNNISQQEREELLSYLAAASPGGQVAEERAGDRTVIALTRSHLLQEMLDNSTRAFNGSRQAMSALDNRNAESSSSAGSLNSNQSALDSLRHSLLNNSVSTPYTTPSISNPANATISPATTASSTTTLPTFHTRSRSLGTPRSIASDAETSLLALDRQQEVRRRFESDMAHHNNTNNNNNNHVQLPYFVPLLATPGAWPTLYEPHIRNTTSTASTTTTVSDFESNAATLGEEDRFTQRSRSSTGSSTRNGSTVSRSMLETNRPGPAGGHPAGLIYEGSFSPGGHPMPGQPIAADIRARQGVLPTPNWGAYMQMPNWLSPMAARPPHAHTPASTTDTPAEAPPGRLPGPIRNLSDHSVRRRHRPSRSTANPAAVLGTREEVQRDDYTSPITSMFMNEWENYHDSERRRREGEADPRHRSSMSTDTGTTTTTTASREEVLAQHMQGVADRRAQHLAYLSGPRGSGSESLRIIERQQHLRAQADRMPENVGDATAETARIVARQQRLRAQADLMQEEQIRHIRERDRNRREREANEVGVKSLDHPERPENLKDEDLTLKVDCKVCYGQIADMLLVPCNHLVLCQWCAEAVAPTVPGRELVAPRSICPVCRATVQKKIKVFRS